MTSVNNKAISNVIVCRMGYHWTWINPRTRLGMCVRDSMFRCRIYNNQLGICSFCFRNNYLVRNQHNIRYCSRYSSTDTWIWIIIIVVAIIFVFGGSCAHKNRQNRLRNNNNMSIVNTGYGGGYNNGYGGGYGMGPTVIIDEGYGGGGYGGDTVVVDGGYGGGGYGGGNDFGGYDEPVYADQGGNDGGNDYGGYDDPVYM